MSGHESNSVLGRLSDILARTKQADRTFDNVISRRLAERIKSGPGLLSQPTKKADENDQQDAGNQASSSEDEDSEYDDAVGLLDNDDEETVDTDREEEDEDSMLDLEPGDFMVKTKDGSVSALTWLRSLIPHVNGLKNAPLVSDCPNLRPGIEPKPHQWEAVAKIEYNMKSQFKGIVIGDPPGLGKTLPAQIAIMKSLPTATSFSLVVVPSSLIEQWVGEFKNYFVEGTIDVYVLNDSTIPFTELLKHDVILVSYTFCMSQYRKWHKYLAAIKDLEQREEYDERMVPRRPNLSIFAEGLQTAEFKRPYLVLDEAHVIKNTNTMTYHAIEFLRAWAHGCIMLTGSPIVNKWQDLYALATLVDGHPIHSISMAERLFTERDANEDGRRKLPAGNFHHRLHMFLMAFMIRRPKDTISLPPLTEKISRFALSKEEQTASDTAFSNFEHSRSRALAVRRTSAQKFDHKQRSGRRGKQSKVSSTMNWEALFKAQQYIYHPILIDIMELVHNARDPDSLQSMKQNTLDDSVYVAKWENWRSDLRKDELWRKSSRVRKVISIFNKERDYNPGVKTLIFSESVYFLDILQIAFEEMHEPISGAVFSGRLNSMERTRLVADFDDTPGQAVMFISQAAGGLELNLSKASLVILCGPFRKAIQEEQAIKRAHRMGQEKPVTVVRIVANDCLVENFREKIRNREKNNNDKIMQHLSQGVVYANIE